LLTTAFAPHAPYTVSDAPLKKIRMFSDELELPVHMHVHETRHEVEQEFAKTGMRPLQRLNELGLVTPMLSAVHMTQLTREEMDLLAETGAHVVHCPESNLKLASGFCSVAELIARGVNVALGTDGAASNNDLDMFGEMRTAALLAKAVVSDASALPASMALKMATLNGAKALGIDRETGSLEIGKAADAIAVDLSDLETQPLYCPVSQIVYAASRRQVSDVWVAGKRLLKQRELTTVNLAELNGKIGQWRQRLAS
jgi:5-methylthioadenosine/S-adenosylhomocysteine deaminase